jgi:hypothetical protein
VIVQSTLLSDSLPVRRNKDRTKRVSTSVRNGTALVFDGTIIIKRGKGSSMIRSPIESPRMHR